MSERQKRQVRLPNRFQDADGRWSPAQLCSMCMHAELQQSYRNLGANDSSGEAVSAQDLSSLASERRDQRTGHERCKDSIHSWLY